MDFKKILIISSIILILSLTAVSATDLKDVNATEPIAHDTPLISSMENTIVEKLNATTGTFDNLQVEINNAPTGSVLNLTRDYTGHYGSRIQFNKDLTIDG